MESQWDSSFLADGHKVSLNKGDEKAMIRNRYNRSKKTSDGQEMIHQLPHSALKTEREITKYINKQQFTEGTRGKPNEQLFSRQVVIQLPKIY